MNFWKIKWENIFGIVTGAMLISATIKFIILNGFNLNMIMFDLLYLIVTTLGIMWCVKMTRKFYLKK